MNNNVLDENYSEDFDGSSSAEKQKSGHSSDSTREKIKTPESSPKVRNKFYETKKASEAEENYFNILFYEFFRL